MASVDKNFDKILSKLQQRRRDLENQISATYTRKLANIETNRQLVTECINSAKESADFLNNVLDNNSNNNNNNSSDISADAEIDDSKITNQGHTNLDLFVVRKQLEQQSDIVLKPFPLNTVHFEETQLLFNFVDCGSEKLIRAIDVSEIKLSFFF